MTAVETTTRHRDEDFSLEVVPIQSRRSFWVVGFVMLGFTFFSASMSVGAKLGNGLDLGGYVTEVVMGGLILAVHTGALGHLGAKTGMGFGLLARQSCGSIGSFLSSALISFTTASAYVGIGPSRS